MKLFISSLLALAAMVEAGIQKPDVMIGINVGEEGMKGSLGGIEPRIKWETGGEVAGFDVQGGIDLTITDVDVPPSTTLWGKLKRKISDFGDISIRGDIDANVPESVDLDVRINAYDTSVQMLGRAGSKAVSLDKVAMTKDFSALGGVLSLTPKYDMGGQGDISVGYAVDKTSFKVDAQAKKLTVAHSFTTKDSISPTVTADGDFSLSYSRILDRGTVSATLTPNDSLKVHWTDGVYETTIKAPLEGYFTPNQGLKVNMRRYVAL